MIRRTAPSGDFRVGGDRERRTWPSVGAAISLACNLATRATEADEFGVYRGETKVARVIRDADGAVQVRMVTA